jgi:hypothetical protein
VGRKRTLELLAAAAASCLVLIGASGAAQIDTTPVPVKTSARNELSPAAGSGFFTWAKSRRGHPRVYDVWGQQEGQPPFKINAPGTSGFGGGIDGTTLVYQQIKKYNSDLRLFDLVNRRRANVPPGINTSRWEWGPTMSGDWLLFGRSVYQGTEQMILHNLTTGEQRVLDTKRGNRGYLISGQVNGAFAVWSKCLGNACDVFRYDIAARTRTPMERNGRLLYAPSITPSGVTYYIRGESTCGGAELVKTTPDGTTFVLAESGSARDVSSTYAAVLPGRPPNEVPGVRIYLESWKCAGNRSDIYSVDDTQPAPPPVPGRH